MENEPSPKKENEELDRYEKIVNWAHEEIEGVRSVYHRLAGIIGIIVATTLVCGTFLTYNTINDMRSDLKQRTDSLADEVKVRIEKEFEQPAIEATIQKAAKDRAAALMSDQIAPEVSKLKQEVNETVKQMGKAISEANIALDEVKNTSEFALLVTKASNDDRASFDALRKIVETKDNKFQDIALDVLLQIAADQDLSTSEAYIDWPKDCNLDPAKASLDDFAYVLAHRLPIYRPAILETIWQQERFPMPVRLAILNENIIKTNSIRTLHKAYKLMDQEAKLGQNILVYEAYTEWWDKHKGNYNKKPENQLTDPNK